MAQKKKSIGSILVALLVAAIVWVLQDRGILGEEGLSNLPGLGGDAGTVEVSGGSFTPVQRSGSGWELLKNCSLITGRNSDGDSFHVRSSKGENEFRLYFVDTPESEFKTYRGGEDNGERIAEQGQEMGGLDRRATTQVGTHAKSFVKKLLSKGGFDVLTKWEDVYGPGRQYCLVIVPWEGREVYLHELLVTQGLARIHTRGADLPQGKRWRGQKDYLSGLEKAARDQKAGAWGL